MYDTNLIFCRSLRDESVAKQYFYDIFNDNVLESVDAASSSERKGNDKLTSPSKETENDIDIESIEETTAQNTQSMSINL